MTIPTKLKLLRGSPGHHPVKGPEPEPLIPDVVPDPPKNLGEDAAEEWRRIAPEVFRLGLLTIADIRPLSAYCQAYGRWMVAEKSLAAMAESDPKFHGLVTRTESGRLVQNPLVRTASEAARDMVSFAQQFGLTPVSRMKLASPNKKPPRKFDGLVVS